MDKQNFQLDSTGSEFALRVALCDLVQRLKRSEFMCKYLEQCRNELANEVIKLRSHNNVLLKEIIETSNSQVKSYSQHTQTNNFDANISKLNNPLDQNFETNLDQNELKKSIKLDSIVDESWEEITNRLINQLKKEIINDDLENENNQLNSPNEDSQEKKSTICSSESNYFDLKSDQNTDKIDLLHATNLYETQEQHMAINDLENLKINDEPIEKIQINTNQIDKFKMTYKLLENYSLMNNNLKVIELHDPNDKNQKKCDIQQLLKTHLKNNKEPDQFKLAESILRNHTLDLEEITRQIMLQNDKLIRLKGKQIRNYFRRQLDKNSNSGPNSELKINLNC